MLNAPRLEKSAPGAPSPAVPLLELQDIHVQFYARRGLFGRTPIRAVNGVTLRIARGETVAVVGESGSGKTTLGRAALHLAPLASGAVRFEGADIGAFDERHLKAFRRQAQAVFQDPYSAINGYMTVQQIVAEGLVVHGEGDHAERLELVRKALADVALTPVEAFLSKYPHTLSGGQRQRVGIARALVLRPTFVVADEPVSMIDASSRAEILLLMRALQRQRGISFLYITHDIASARHFADRVAVMYLGRIIELGTPADVIGTPLHPYTQALIAAVPEPDPTNRLRARPVVPGEPPSPSNLPAGCAFHPRCPKFIPNRCELAVPELLEVRPNHWVACYLHQPA